MEAGALAQLGQSATTRRGAPPSGRRSKSAGRALSCCFTLNNYTIEECTEIRGDNEHYKWICYGEEVGVSGTPHLQGILVNVVRQLH